MSPKNVMFEAGIYNPNLNHASIKGTLMDCSNSSVEHEVKTDEENTQWTSTITLPWSVCNNPVGCPVEEYATVSSSSPCSLYRINFYRINELAQVNQCSSTSCEYLAWSPTMCNPAAFHEPTKFGYLVLDGVEVAAERGSVKGSTST